MKRVMRDWRGWGRVLGRGVGDLGLEGTRFWGGRRVRVGSGWLEVVADQGEEVVVGELGPALEVFELDDYG